MSLTDSQRIGYARQLQANPLWVELVEDMKEKAIAKWRSTPPSDRDARDEAWHADRAVRELDRRIKELSDASLVEDES